MFKRGKATSEVGSAHATDIPEFYASSAEPDFQGTDFLVNFINTGNPNMDAKTPIFWPEYNTSATEPPLLTFLDPSLLNITTDTYRLAPIDAMIALLRQFP